MRFAAALLLLVPLISCGEGSAPDGVMSERGFVEAKYNLAVMYHEWLRAAVTQGSAETQSKYDLGAMYYDWLQVAAKQGEDVVGIWNSSAPDTTVDVVIAGNGAYSERRGKVTAWGKWETRILNGERVFCVDFNEVTWDGFCRPVEVLTLDDARQLHLGQSVWYENSWDDTSCVDVDSGSSFGVLTHCAEHGNVEAQFALGGMYYGGVDVPEDHEEGIRWVGLAAEQGHAEAQFVLGVMYYNGEGVPQNDAEGILWIGMAAEQGHAQAQLVLGQMYLVGEASLTQDEVEAVHWFTLAAAQGMAEAQSLLLRLGEYTSTSTNASTNRLNESSLVGKWDCNGMTIRLARNGRYELAYQPSGMGGHRGRWRVPNDSPNTLVLEDRTDPRWMADISFDRTGKAVQLIAFSPFSGMCSK